MSSVGNLIYKFSRDLLYVPTKPWSWHNIHLRKEDIIMTMTDTEIDWGFNFVSF